MIILLAPYKFTKFDYLIYELDIFQNKIQDKIEIHDLSKITNPKSETIFRLPRSQKVKIFNSISNWEIYFKNLCRNNEIVVLNLLELNSFKSLIIHYKLNKYIKSLIMIKSHGLPDIFLKKKKKISFSKILGKAVKLYKNRSHIKLFLKKKIILSLVKLIKFNEIFYLKVGREKNFFTELRSKKNIFIDYHSHDYSRMRNLKAKQVNKKRFGVFLDTSTPYFKDDYSVMGIKINYDLKKWYDDLNSFLNKAEKVFNCKIIIIPHPKVKNLKNPYYSKNFEVCNDLDAVHKLLPSSQIALSINASTSLGIAIANKRKTCIIYNNQIKKKNYQLFVECKFIAKKSKSPFLNINNFNLKKFKNIKVNKDPKNYVYKYMTSKKIEKKKNYEIFQSLVNRIKTNNFRIDQK